MMKKIIHILVGTLVLLPTISVAYPPLHGQLPSTKYDAKISQAVEHKISQATLTQREKASADLSQAGKYLKRKIELFRASEAMQEVQKANLPATQRINLITRQLAATVVPEYQEYQTTDPNQKEAKALFELLIAPTDGFDWYGFVKEHVNLCTHYFIEKELIKGFVLTTIPENLK